MSIIYLDGHLVITDHECPKTSMLIKLVNPSAVDDVYGIVKACTIYYETHLSTIEVLLAHKLFITDDDLHGMRHFCVEERNETLSIIMLSKRIVDNIKDNMELLKALSFDEFKAFISL